MKMASEMSLHTDLHALEHYTHSTLCPEPDIEAPEPAHWTFFHKPIIVMVMGGLVSGAGAILILVHSLGVMEAPHAAAPCLSIGLMFVAVGLVWIPILKEKLRRRSSGVATDEDSWEPGNN